MRMTIKTMAQLEDYYYNELGSHHISKLDAPHMTSTSGMYNPIYGRKVWDNVNMKYKIWGVLKKIPYQEKGWRAKTARAYSALIDGVPEGGEIPETKKSTYVEMESNSRSLPSAESVSSVMGKQSQYDDAVGGDAWKRAVKDASDEHMKNLNLWALRPNATAISERVTSIDHIISSYAESVEHSLTTEVDIYGVDRHTGGTGAGTQEFNAWLNANVQSSSSLRPLSVTMMDAALTSARDNGGDGPNIIVTGHDGQDNITNLVQPQMRVTPQTKLIRPSVNGIQAGVSPGVDGAVRVNMYQDMPIILSADVPKDTSGGSRIYFYNTDEIVARMLRPTVSYEAGLNHGNPHSLNTLTDEILFLTEYELIAYAPNRSSKIRDLNLPTV